MSKLTNEKLVALVDSADKRIERIEEQKRKAQARIDSADAEIREIQAERTGRVALLAARGLDENGEPVDGSSTDEDDEAPVEAPEFA